MRLAALLNDATRSQTLMIHEGVRICSIVYKSVAVARKVIFLLRLTQGEVAAGSLECATDLEMRRGK